MMNCNTTKITRLVKKIEIVLHVTWSATVNDNEVFLLP